MKAILHVLLVDDDALFCEAVTEVARADPELSRRLRIQRLADGTEAIEYLAGSGPYSDRRRFPWPDLVLLDERMPRLDGTDALIRLRAQPETRALLVGLFSTSDQERLVREGYEAGANFFIVKPFGLDELGRMLRATLDFLTTVVELPLRPAPQLP